MSELEQYWESIRSKLPEPRPPEWHQLDARKQTMVVHSVNLMLQALYD